MIMILKEKGARFRKEGMGGEQRFQGSREEGRILRG